MINLLKKKLGDSINLRNSINIEQIDSLNKKSVYEENGILNYDLFRRMMSGDD